MNQGSLRRRLATHIGVRLVVATALLGAALALQSRAPGLPVSPFFALIALTYAVSLGFILSLRIVDRAPWLAEVHFTIDVVLISVAVRLTGGVGSLFTPLYMLPIVAASAARSRRSGMQLAAISTAAFVGLVLFQYISATGPALEPGDLADLPRGNVALFTVGLNVFGFFAVAFLSGSLAERVRRGEAQLERASETIADLQAFNQYVLDSLVSGLATADAQNRLVTFNRSAMLIVGRTGEAPLGQPATEVLRLPPEVAATLSDDLDHVRSKRIDYPMTRADGQDVEIGLSVAALPLPDGSRGFLYTFQDVTDMKRLERSARLQQRLAAVGEVAAGIAHEIRNPLASMSGSMQILRQELPLSSDQAQLMDIVLRESERLNHTIKSFLAYARPQRFEVHRLDLRTVVDETARLLRNSPEVNERHAVDVLDVGRPVMVDADEGQVRQVLWNLATNGLKAMPAGGRLTLSATEGRMGDGRMMLLCVEDDGVGIRPEDVEGIFQPFRGSFGRGSGLGLAIVHRLVSDYGGRIEVRPKPQGGTSVTVGFPPPQEAAARPAS